MKRTFIAIKIPLLKQKQELVFNVQQQLKDEKIKWVDLWNMHVTLFFLGDTKVNLIAVISEKIKEQLADMKSLKLKMNGIGVFKSLNDPKVVFIEIEASDELKNLKTRIDQAIVPFGFKNDKREFKPHLTLGRIKFIQDKTNLKRVLENSKFQDFGDIHVGEVLLYESILTPKGPIYKVLNRFALK
jgi:2'-5' RNA ligase